uniref:HOOK N-terminal domain-containing protein n=1 Tax=Timema cristinae TaxID=61476 RepID=A0A7R9CYT0_TIMCR|nr:unnamed protein product [Timema cristinae]
MASTELEDFMSGPLVTWFGSCLENPNKLTDYEDLADGVLVYEVLLQIDPEPAHHGVLPSFGNALVRTRNMDIVIKNMKALYEEELCQVLLVLPDCVKLGREPESKMGIENMHLLLLLLLGCAVQCPNKETFIDRIKQMNVEEQHAIVECIKQITDNQELVLNQDTLEVFSPDLMLSHIRRLVRERDEYLQNWTCLVTQERVEGGDQLQQKASSPVSGGDNHHLAVELADWKARLRKQRQELEEKSEALTETKEELEHSKILLTKLRQEVQELMQDARAAKALRDELDVMRERAERVDKLESEVQRYREKLSDVEFYKTRVDELREDNKVLLETKEMLEEQLLRARKRGDHVLELESELLKYKQQVNELAIEQEAGREKMQELYEENAQLQVLMKSALNETSTVSIESEAGDDFEGARALKLELENRRLLSTIDNLKESSFHESSSTILELEKEKKKMSIKAEKSRMSELEANMDTITKEKQRVQCLVDSLQRRLEELERSLESNNTQLEHWRTEAGKIPTLQARNSEASTRIEELERETQNFQREVTRLKENQEVKDVSLDKYSSEMASMQKEINKYVKELDDATSQIARLHELERESQELMRRAAVDRQTLTTLKGDLVAQKLSTQQLKSNLEKLGLDLDWLLDPDTALERQVHHFFETLTQFIFQIASSQEIQKAVHDLHAREGTLYNCSKCQSQQTTPDEPQTQDIPSTDSMAELYRLCDDLRQEVATLQGSADALHTENARLQVDVATLRSQVGSLTTQHTALQLANSQLAVEKDELANALVVLSSTAEDEEIELVKEKGLQKSAHQQLLLDQMTLQSLHEQLSTEYESLQQERDSLKVVQRDLKLEVRTLKEQNTTHAAVEQERDKLRTESRSLGNLRAEHSSLKDDFRNLFTASEKLKLEFRNLQEEYRSLRTDSGNLKLLNLELKGELTKRSDHVTMLEVELSKLTNRCEDSVPAFQLSHFVDKASYKDSVPASQLSHFVDKASYKESVPASQLSHFVDKASYKDSVPDSQLSHFVDKASYKDSVPAFQLSHFVDKASYKDSVPAFQLSHFVDKASYKDSVPAFQLSHFVDKASYKDSVPAFQLSHFVDKASYKDSVPASQLSHFVDKASYKDSVPASQLSHFVDKASYKDSVPASQLSHFVDKASYKDSVPASQLSHFVDKASYKDSVPASQLSHFVDKASYKDSVPASQLSHFVDKASYKDSVPASQLSHFVDKASYKDSVPASQLSHFVDKASYKDSVPASQLSHFVDKASYKDSVPASQLSHFVDKASYKDSVPDSPL